MEDVSTIHSSQLQPHSSTTTSDTTTPAHSYSHSMTRAGGGAPWQEDGEDAPKTIEQYYAMYDPYKGLDIAVGLGACLLIFSLYLFIKYRNRHKYRCSSGGAEEAQVHQQGEVQVQPHVADALISSTIHYLEVPKVEYGRDPVHCGQRTNCDRCRHKYYNTRQYQLCRYWLSSQHFHNQSPAPAPLPITDSTATSTVSTGVPEGQVKGHRSCHRTHSTPVDRPLAAPSTRSHLSLMEQGATITAAPHQGARRIRRYHSCEEEVQVQVQGRGAERTRCTSECGYSKRYERGVAGAGGIPCSNSESGSGSEESVFLVQ